jgi:aryl-alcohol dehydrogenase-like predicted oxidoreductase
MDYINFGSSSLKVSRIGFGAMGIGDKAWRSWVLDEQEARPLVRKAVEAGINFYDTCDFYSAGESERILGSLLGEFGSRSEFVIATKFGNPMGKGPNARGYSRKHIVEAVEASLRRLKTDYIDLYQTHIWDETTNIDEMMAALDLLVCSGKVLYVGAADMPCWQFAKALYGARFRGQAAFVSMQNHFNAVWREDERELLPLCQHEGIAMLPYSPMARGFLCGKERRNRDATERARTDGYTWEWYGREADHAVGEIVDAIARQRDLTPAQIALAWVLNRLPQATPIIGATSLPQLDQALSAVHVVLSPEEMQRIGAAYQPRPRSGHF